MKNFETFVKRLKKLGIVINFIGNYPWVYFDTINSKKSNRKI